MTRHWHQTIALWFGKQEHRFGRIIAIPIIFGILLNLYNHKSWGWSLDSWNYHDNLNLYIFLAVFACWVIYLLSHTLEKKFYNGEGFRGR